MNYTKHQTLEKLSEMLQNNDFAIASSFRRIIAYVIDVSASFLLTYLAWISTGFERMAFPDMTKEGLAKMTLLLWAWTIFPFYYGLLAMLFGRTIGCWIASIRVIRTDGSRIGFFRGTLRGAVMGNTFAILFPFLIVLHSIYITIEWNLRKHNLKMTGWDIGSRTLVIASAKHHLQQREVGKGP